MRRSVHVQYRSDARYNKRAFAFTCNRVRLRVRTRSPPRANVFASPHKRVRLHPRTRSPPHERKRTRLFRWHLTVASTRLQPHFNCYLVCFPNFVWVKGHQQFGGRISRCARPLITSCERVRLDRSKRFVERTNAFC